MKLQKTQGKQLQHSERLEHRGLLKGLNTLLPSFHLPTRTVKTVVRAELKSALPRVCLAPSLQATTLIDFHASFIAACAHVSVDTSLLPTECWTYHSMPNRSLSPRCYAHSTCREPSTHRRLLSCEILRPTFVQRPSHIAIMASMGAYGGSQNT